MTIPGSVTRFPNGLCVNAEDSIFADLSSAEDPSVLFQDFFDFTLPLDFGGGDSEWNEYGGGSADYPITPFGVIELTPSLNNAGYGINQDICQAVNFTFGTDLWARFRVASPVGSEDSQIWCGMAGDVPNNPGVDDQWDNACLFHVLATGEITLEVWEGDLGLVPVQTITGLGTMPRDGTYIELAYHYDGIERITIAVNKTTTTSAVVPIVPSLTLHGTMGCLAAVAAEGVALFDYYYSAQLRQPL